tara:strand:+ start:59 stop:301 length:243 start_codon:yes stop_codon:yes gene_type:complete
MNEKKEVDKVEETMDLEKGITLNDLIVIKNIINLASRRGAFSVEEFKDIGDVYSRLDDFVSMQLKLLKDKEGESKDDVKV